MAVGVGREFAEWQRSGSGSAGAPTKVEVRGMSALCAGDSFILLVNIRPDDSKRRGGWSLSGGSTRALNTARAPSHGRVDTRAETCIRLEFEQSALPLAHVWKIAVDPVGRALLISDYLGRRLFALSLGQYLPDGRLPAGRSPPALQHIALPLGVVNPCEIAVVDRDANCLCQICRRLASCASSYRTNDRTGCEAAPGV